MQATAHRVEKSRHDGATSLIQTYHIRGWSTATWSSLIAFTVSL